MEKQTKYICFNCAKKKIRLKNERFNRIVLSNIYIYEKLETVFHSRRFRWGERGEVLPHFTVDGPQPGGRLAHPT